MFFASVLFINNTANSQDTTNIVFKVPTAQLPRISDAMKGLYPIPIINTGTDLNPVWEPEFTDNAWSKECIRRWVKRQVARWEQKIARDSILYTEDTTLIK